MSEYKQKDRAQQPGLAVVKLPEHLVDVAIRYQATMVFFTFFFTQGVAFSAWSVTKLRLRNRTI